jgi:hypothetical protein
MFPARLLLIPTLASFILAIPQRCTAADVLLPAEAALPVTTVGAAGFRVRTVQAPQNIAVGNNFVRALRQLDGTLTDDNGVLVDNIATPGPNPDGSYDAAVIDFGVGTGLFTSDIEFPGADPSLERFSTEVMAFLKLSAGTYRMAVTSGFAATVEVDDDGWRLFCGANPRSYFATPVAEFFHSGASYPTEAEMQIGNTNEFNVVAPVDGVYPFRLVYWQTTRLAILEWYLVLKPGTDAEQRLLVNDPTLQPMAYRTVNSALANSAYVAEVTPVPGGAGVSPTIPIELILIDGENPVALGSLKLYFNDNVVTPQSVARVGNLVQMQYSPNSSRTDSQNRLRLEFADTAGLKQTNSWQFTSAVAGGATTVVHGQWDFSEGDLRATVGRALEYFDGPGGVTASGTQFGSTTELGIDGINGEVARVMRVPGDYSDRRIGYKMFHGISPNGGGLLVNQYTLIMDLYVVDNGGAASLLQISSLDNSDDDGDLFWNQGNFGQGTGGYDGTGAFTAGAWHRMIAAYDMAATPPVVTKFVDGAKEDDWTVGQYLDHPRRALQSYAILFADGVPSDERTVMYVNSIQIRSGKLSDAEMEALGGPSAAGIPLPEGGPAPTLSVSLAAGRVSFSWPATAIGYTLEATLKLTNPNWQAVNGVVGTSASLNPAEATQFFRLRKP